MSKQNWILTGVGALALIIIAGMTMSVRPQDSLAAVPSGCSDPFALGDQSYVLCLAEIFEETPTETPTETLAPVLTDTATSAPSETPTDTQVPPTLTETTAPTITSTPGNVTPFAGAPACVHPNNETFHTLWNSALGCHYDHEHGTSPFTSAVAAVFPGIQDFLGGVQIGHTNLSSPMETTMKHGGFKWSVNLADPNGCAVGFEGGTVAIDKHSILYHNFGRQDVEFETNIHTAVFFLEQCKQSNLSDKGYIYVTTRQQYGQRIMPYQNMNLVYPDSFSPSWDTKRGPYFTTECEGPDFMAIVNGVNTLIDCRTPGDMIANNLSKWSSKLSGGGPRPELSPFQLLFDIRDVYQRLDSAAFIASGRTHPFTWLFVCGGNAYNPIGCRFNNSTSTLHELKGTIPASWDGSAIDSDPRPGRVSGEFFITSGGAINSACSAPGGNCYPIKLLNAFVGTYSTDLCVEKCSNPTPPNTPERDFYFCNGVPCSETSPGAVPSGWIGKEN